MLERGAKLIGAAKALNGRAAEAGTQLLKLPPAEMGGAGDHQGQENTERREGDQTDFDVHLHVIRNLAPLLTRLPSHARSNLICVFISRCFSAAYAMAKSLAQHQL